MIKKHLITMLLLFGIQASWAQGWIQPVEDNLYTNRVFPDKNGGVTVLFNSDPDYYLQKFTAFGAPGPIFNFKAINPDFQWVEQLSDGSFIASLIGNQNTVAKIGKDFQLIWAKTYGGFNLHRMFEKKDGGLMLVMSKGRPNNTLFNINPQGDTINTTLLSKYSYHNYFVPKFSADGLIYLEGNQLKSFTADGQLDWIKTLPLRDTINGINIRTLTNQYLIASRDQIIIVDDQGAIVSDRNIDVNETLLLGETADNSYLTYTYNPQTEVKIIKKWNSINTNIWSQTYDVINHKVSSYSAHYLTGSNSTTLSFDSSAVFLQLDQTGKAIHKRELADHNYLTVKIAKDGLIFGMFYEPKSVFKIDLNAPLYTNTVSGKLFDDKNKNCVYDEGELFLKNWVVYKTPENTLTITDSMGNYTLPADTGSGQVMVIPANPVYLTTCPENGILTVNFNSMNSTVVDKDFALTPSDCPFLQIELSTPRLRRCFGTSHVVKYSNSGSKDAENAEVRLKIPSSLIIQSASKNFTFRGDTLIFSIGTLEPGHTGIITIEDSVSCTAPLGSSACIRAEIIADNSCPIAAPNWDKSDVSVSGKCNNNVSEFTITNIGNSPMSDSSDYRIYGNEKLLQTGKVKLAGNASEVLTLEGDYSYRVEADQLPGYPFESYPRAFSESCNGSDIEKAGFIAFAPQDDARKDVEISCNAIVGSFDPNDKSVSPGGAGHSYINKGQELEYTIRFQNTGTDTALTVRIVDTLSSFLDLKTFNPGVSSHNNTFKIFSSSQPIVEWTFKNINLPDSNVNEKKSHGFITYKIKPKNTIMESDKIFNAAAIYFDYNDPVITNTVISEITTGDFISKVLNPFSEINGSMVTLFPNPFQNGTTITTKSGKAPYSFKIFNATGSIVKTLDKVENNMWIDRNNLEKGLYLYQLMGADGSLVGRGKMMVD